jgi:hypothetical protein
MDQKSFPTGTTLAQGSFWISLARRFRSINITCLVVAGLGIHCLQQNRESADPWFAIPLGGKGHFPVIISTISEPDELKMLV